MHSPLVIKTIRQQGEFKFKEKGSLFISQVFHVSDQEEAAELLKSIKKKYYDATHHCSAWFLFPDMIKYSDDGEPNGTAGIRILNAIQHYELTNVFIVVIRYYGGTKLGVGPLGRAYYEAAKNVIENSPVISLELYSEYSVIFDYDYTSSVHHFLSQAGADIKESRYTDKPELIFYIKPDKIKNFRKNLKEISRGTISINCLNETVYR